MYAFDEKGNVLIDTAQAELLEVARRNRTISPRAQALSQGQYIPYNPITQTTWHMFGQKLGVMFSEIYRSLKIPMARPGSSIPRGSGDFKAIYAKILTDWASADLQGFKGALPAVEINPQELVFFLPADGAVIRYLGRLLRKYPGFFDISIAAGGGFMTRISTIDNSAATLGPNDHCMAIRVRDRFGSGFAGSRVDSGTNTLRAIIKTLDLKEILGGVNQVFTTLSRKITSTDGMWGEEPRFPIVNFNRKVRFEEWKDLQQYDRNFHGNNKELYSDRGIYRLIDKGLKHPFHQVSSSSGEYKWTQPKQ